MRSAMTMGNRVVNATATVLDEEWDFVEGQQVRHKPTGLTGRVKWLPMSREAPFMYMEIYEHGWPVNEFKQDRISEFEAYDG